MYCGSLNGFGFDVWGLLVRDDIPGRGTAGGGLFGHFVVLLHVDFPVLVEVDVLHLGKQLSLLFLGQFLFLLVLDPVARVDVFHLQVLGEGQVAALLFKDHQTQHDNKHQPVDVVTQHRGQVAGVLPSEQGVEDVPPVVQFRVAAVDMVHGLSDVVGPVPVTTFGGVTATGKVESIVFKVPSTTGEKTGGDQIQDRGGQDQENLQRGPGGTVVQQKPDQTTTDQADHHGQRVRGRMRALRGDTGTGNEHDGFQPFPHHGDEGQDEHGVSSTQEPDLEVVSLTVRDFDQRPRDLHSPLTLHLVHSQHRDPHHGDHHRRDHTKNTFPQILGSPENVLLQRVVRTDETCTDGQTDDEPENNPSPHLDLQLTVQHGVLVADRLVQKRQQHGDNNHGLQTLPEHNEENSHVENFVSHGGM